MKGMQFLVQSGVPISRPDDFLAEMYKTDEHMAKVKSRILQQQVKIKTFEEKKQRAENKRFHKALKDFKMKAKHSEKRENMEQINQLKRKIKEKGDDMEDADFDRVMKGKRAPAKSPKVLDSVREKVRQRNKKKNEFKQSGKGRSSGPKKAKAKPPKSKRPGKNARGRGKRR